MRRSFVRASGLCSAIPHGDLATLLAEVFLDGQPHLLLKSVGTFGKPQPSCTSSCLGIAEVLHLAEMQVPQAPNQWTALAVDKQRKIARLCDHAVEFGDHSRR